MTIRPRSTSISIVRLHAKDIPAVHAMLVAEYTECAIQPITRELRREFKRVLRNILRSKSEVCFVAVDGDVPIGFLNGVLKTQFLTQKRPTYGFVADMYVKPAYRRKKVGTRLWKAFRSWCKEKNMKQIILNSELTAHAFWKKQGFEITHQRMRAKM